MKSTPSELISTFRKKISFQTILLIALCIVGGIVFFLLQSPNPVLDGIYTLTPILFLVLGLDIYERRKKLSAILDPAAPEASIEKMEAALNTIHQNFRSTNLIRVIAAVVLLVTLFILIFFHPQSEWIGRILVIFVGMVLLSMWKSWWLMSDRMVLQDLKHSVKETHSEIS
jgi:hypothetical protein